MLNQLRAGQQVEFHFAPESQFAIFMQIGAQVEGHKADQPTLTQHAGMPMYSCMLHRVETTDLAVPVLLNDRRVELPALHAMCTLDDNQEAHIYYLDQPANPLTLAFQLGPLSSRLQTIKITLPPPEKAPAPAAGSGGGGGGGGGGAQMEADLAAKKPVEIYGIYFDFNSATIKPESEAVLQEIAGIMQKDPDWKLDVRGHTDNVGDDSFNLGLSQRRAAAVKDALVRRYKIPPDHLATSGYGASQPIETNKTMEGRARNRRVELQRQ
jgi:outer membrane protein OmpA-like peptidoglycan-associated protein